MGQEKKIKDLTTREQEVAELIAWGASKKEIAEHLSLSVRTIECHTRNIYEKIGYYKSNELSAWWFCNKFNISFSLAPAISSFIATVLLALFVSTNIVTHNSNTLARRATRTNRTTQTGRSTKGRRKEFIFNI